MKLAKKLVFVCLICLVAAACKQDDRGSQTPGISDKTGAYETVSVEDEGVVNAAHQAIRLQSTALNTSIELVKILSAQQQVVAGMNYALRLRVKIDGTEQSVDCVIWWQEWNQETPYQVTSWSLE